jgi:hypothetical protein
LNDGDNESILETLSPGIGVTHEIKGLRVGHEGA